MSDVEAVQTLARHLRHHGGRALASRPGPWFTSPGQLPPMFELWRDLPGDTVEVFGWFEERGESDAVAHYVSMLPPEVGLAVADLLDEIVAWHQEGLGTCDGIDRTNYPDALRGILAAALAVARAYDPPSDGEGAA